VKTKWSWSCCIFIHCFALQHILLFCLLWERLWKEKTRLSNQSTCEWDCLSLMIFHLVRHLPRSFLSFSLTFLSRLLSYCLSSKHSWLIWPWGPGHPASLRVSPSLTQLKPAGSSALGVIAYESPALPKDQISLSIPASLPTKRRRW